MACAGSISIQYWPDRRVASPARQYVRSADATDGRMRALDCLASSVAKLAATVESTLAASPRPHRNTVLYRLECLNQLIAADLRGPQVRFILQLALQAGAIGRRLNGNDDPPPTRGSRRRAGTGRSRSSAALAP